jgi:hypothetical protein
MTELKFDNTISRDYVKNACQNWHYSKKAPPYFFAVGFYENDVYIGCITFSHGANCNMLKPYGMSQSQGCELTRCAFKSHDSPMSKIMAIAIKELKEKYYKLRLIVSYADPEQGHYGTIYQAANWIYTGMTSGDYYYIINGEKRHRRQVGYGPSKTWKPEQATAKIAYCGRHRYLFPINPKTRKHILRLAKAYPNEL